MHGEGGAAGPGLKGAVQFTFIQGDESPCSLRSCVPTMEFGTTKADFGRGVRRLVEDWARNGGLATKLAELGGKWGKMALLLHRHLQ